LAAVQATAQRERLVVEPDAAFGSPARLVPPWNPVPPHAAKGYRDAAAGTSAAPGPGRAGPGMRRALVAAAVARAVARPVRAVDRLELLEAPPGADRHARERALGEMHGHLRLEAQPLVE